MDLLLRETHGIVVGAMGRPGRPFGHMSARQARFIERLRVHPVNARVRCEGIYGVGHRSPNGSAAFFPCSSPNLEQLEVLTADAPPARPMSQSFMAQTGRKCLTLLQFRYNRGDFG